MHSDSLHVKGATHDVCQDFAAHECCGESGWRMAVADGCSSSPRSEVGSMLLALAALTTPGANWDNLKPLFYTAWSAAKALQHQDMLPLDLSRANLLDATILRGGLDTVPGVYRVWGVGDGTVVVNYHDGRRVVHDYSFPSGYPQYLAYEGSPERKRAVDDLNHGHVCYRRTVWAANGQEMSQATETLIDSWSVVVDLKGYDVAAVTIFTDGVQSFTDGSGVAIPYLEVVKELTAYKGWQGAFVRRRLLRFLAETAKRGWRHADDLSMAGTYFPVPTFMGVSLTDIKRGEGLPA